MRTQQQIVNHYGPHLKGLIADAAVCRRSGGELAIHLEASFATCDKIIRQMYDELTAVVKVEVEKPKPEPQKGTDAKK